MTPPHFLVVCPHVNTRTIMKDIFESLILVCLLIVMGIVACLLFVVGIVIYLACAAIPVMVVMWIIKAL